jgi:hypothetical protein
MFNGNDGFGTSGAIVDCLRNYIRRNGGVRTIVGGRGDGISYHDESEGLIAFNTVLDNEKGGIVNLESNTLQILGNYLDHNNLNAYILADSDTAGEHLWHSNVIIVRTDDQPEGIRRDGVANAATIEAINNTIVGENASGSGMSGIDYSRNNIIAGFAVGINDYSGVTTDSDYECVFDCVSAYDGVTPGTNSIVSDPQLQSDYSIPNSSPCFRTGVATDVTQAQNQQQFTSPPNRGAFA